MSSTPLCRVPVVVDDFIRNFLVRNEMHETLEWFEQEWYLLNERGVVTEQRKAIHEQYQLNAVRKTTLILNDCIPSTSKLKSMN